MTKKELKIIKNWRKSWFSKGKRHKFLPISKYFVGSIFDEACKKAYFPSISRAFKSNKSNPSNKFDLKKARVESQSFLSNELKDAYCHSSKVDTDKKFDKWIKKIAIHIRKIYHDHKETNYTYGNAQKFISMAIKYLLSSPNIDPNHHLFAHCYIPIDRIIMEKFKKNFHIKPLSTSWSNCDSWVDIQTYENAARKYAKRGNIKPIILEIKTWQGKILLDKIVKVF